METDAQAEQQVGTHRSRKREEMAKAKTVIFKNFVMLN